MFLSFNNIVRWSANINGAFVLAWLTYAAVGNNSDNFYLLADQSMLSISSTTNSPASTYR